MSNNRLQYQNWIVELGVDPIQLARLGSNDLSTEISQTDSEQVELINQVVRKAMTSLDDDEHELIIRFHFMGETYVKISELTNREIYKLAAIHKRAVKKLKAKLTSFVKESYNIDSEEINTCLICNHEEVIKINLIISQRDKRKTWREVLKVLRNEYNLKLSTPQIIMGHEKYHM